MPDDTNSDNGPRMIGFEMLQNITDLDRTHRLGVLSEPTDTAWNRRNSTLRMSERHVENWMTLMSILEDEEIMRLRRRVHLKMPDTVEASQLAHALSAELMRREIEEHLATGKPLETGTII
jgi:hypothetical protein